MQADIISNLKYVHGIWIGKIFVQTGAITAGIQEQKQEKYIMAVLVNL